MPREMQYRLTKSDLPCSLRGFLKKQGFSHRILSSLKQIPSAVTVDGVPTKLITYLTSPCTVCLTLPEEHLSVERLTDTPLPPVTVVYEDSDLIVFDKPPFMATHPVHGHQGNTLADFAARHAAEKGETYTFRPLGRLDRNTSGLCVAAKTSYAARAADTVDKVYLGLVTGVLSAPGKVDSPIRHKEGSRILQEVGDGGLPAVTHYVPIKMVDGNTLTEFRLETGRTHQIRVHMASLGHPLVGDDLYGSSCLRLPRHALHCSRLSVTHPVTGERLTFTSPLPADIREIISCGNSEMFR